MGEKKELRQAIREALPELLEEELPKYLKKHRTELKRCLINTDGFRSAEEYEALGKRLQEETRAREKTEEELTSTRTKLATAQAAQADADRRATQAEKDACQARQKAAADVADAKRDAQTAIQMEREQAQRMVADANAVRDAMEEERDEAQAVRAHYESVYAFVETLAERYRALPEAIRQGVAQIVGDGGNGAQLLVRLSQLDNYESLWDYAANLLLRDAADKAAAETLVALVDASFLLVNASHATPILAVPDIVPGARYQPNVMQKTPESRQQGAVARVLLRGAVYPGSGNCLRKTLVEIL